MEKNFCFKDGIMIFFFEDSKSIDIVHGLEKTTINYAYTFDILVELVTSHFSSYTYDCRSVEKQIYLEQSDSEPIDETYKKIILMLKEYDRI